MKFSSLLLYDTDDYDDDENRTELFIGFHVAQDGYFSLLNLIPNSALEEARPPILFYHRCRCTELEAAVCEAHSLLSHLVVKKSTLKTHLNCRIQIGSKPIG